MSAMAVVIIVLVFAMILGPVFLMRPSPRQKRLSRWRQTAIENGFSVTMRKVDEDSLAEYRYLWAGKAKRSHWRLIKKSYVHDIHFLGYWQWDSQGRPTQSMLNTLSQSLSTLPEGVKLIEGSEVGLSCCWDERGTEEDFKALMDGIKNIVEDH